MIPDVAIGAILAAIIGAMLSLAGLIVAKESKVSEFRQAWIDSLRSELASFASNLNSLADADTIDFESDAKRYDAVKEQTGKLNESYYSIALRLNVDEDSSKAVRDSMLKLSRAIKDPLLAAELDFDAEQGAFIKASNTLLKAEWKRVKAGEKVYQRTRSIAIGVIGVFALAIVVIIAVNFANRKPVTAKGGNPQTAMTVPDAAKPVIITREQKVTALPTTPVQPLSNQAAASNATDSVKVEEKAK